MSAASHLLPARMLGSLCWAMLLVVLAGCPSADYPSVPHRAVAYGPHPEKAETCTACHRGQPRSQTQDQQLCLDCHREISAQVTAKKGHHGRVLLADEKARCANCHREHSGSVWPERMIQFPASTQRTFRPLHERATGFVLDGKHGELDCEGCHDRKRPSGRTTFWGLSGRCGSCHAAQAPHGPAKSKNPDCRSCHQTQGWTSLLDPLHFDHQQQTAFPLRGAHVRVDCKSCHLSEKAQHQGVPRGPLFVMSRARVNDCRSCHAKQSPHGGSYGPRLCKSCHAPERGFAARTFRHGEETGFALMGKHAQTACSICHRRELHETPSPRCESCHNQQSTHGTRFARQGDCSTCHSSTSFADNNFEHRLQTGFPLDHRHAVTTLRDCRKCHRSPAGERHGFEKLRITATERKATPERIDCRACHAHKQQHQDSRTAAQREKPCLTCHEQAGSTRLSKTLLRASRMGPSDSEKLGWFGHGEEKPFRLLGSHALSKLGSCRACHSDPVRGFHKLSTDCVSCHKDRDVHQGSLGTGCQRCHDPLAGSFTKTPKLRHDAVYKLEGSHQTAPCAGCHPTEDPATQYHGRPTVCGDAACHQRDDTLHRGSRGAQCGSSECHSPRHGSFRIPRFHSPTDSSVLTEDAQPALGEQK